MFIIQYNMIREEQLLMLKNVVNKYPHQYVGVIPFSHEIKSDIPLVGKDFIPYGSTLLTNLANELKWSGLYFDLEKFDYGVALKNRNDMLNDGVMTIQEAQVFLNNQSEDSDWFIRPTKDLKQFSGYVTKAGEFLEWSKKALESDSSIGHKLTLETEIVVSRPQNIQSEWRWFVIDGKVVDGSMYRFNDKLIKEHIDDLEVINEAQGFADKWLPNKNCVMDLALVDNKVKVIEFNCINSSGFYNHNVEIIFDSLWNNFNKELKCMI